MEVVELFKKIIERIEEEIQRLKDRAKNIR